MKVALITGSGQGIGRATAERFLNGGYQVVATDITNEGLAELSILAPDRVKTLCQNITDTHAPQEAIDLAMSSFGQLDVLVNNAGIGRPKPVGDTSDEEIDRFLDVNIRAQIRFSRAALSVLKSGGAMVNICSIFGFRGSAGGGVYSVTKAAMVGLTRQMAADYGPQGIRINGVAPGLIKTPMTKDRIENNKEFRRLMVESTPFPRVGTPEDIANAVHFLSSEEAAFISGQVLVVDGGWLAANGARAA
ncbi:SDR family oxidoreductase [Ochrobactrum sp. Q0168]|uniref:SDR family NAD(P)-dependent oxidoreductase n=1 Tax=Ochrobactrum sp. Q0168 TaxID=2793241 RepID=UPI0018EBCC35|nr:SDR family oxidoreductase [Ochrobactrum sp. Q0168]